MEKIRVAIVGYGNIGSHLQKAIASAADFELAGVVRREESPHTTELEGVNVVEAIEELGRLDVAFLSLPTRMVESQAERVLALGINTVDSFDIHSQIVGLRSRLDAVAQQHNAVAMIAAGWDPGIDSMIRAILEMSTPEGTTHTNFGPGVSMGHSVAARAVQGVRSALSITLPESEGVHSRRVYVEIEQGYTLEQIAKAIREDEYFAHDTTQVIKVESVEEYRKPYHGVKIVRDGVASGVSGQKFEFDMRINNPALTAQIMLGAARASLKQRAGAYTLIEIPLVDLLIGTRDEAIQRLV